MPSPRPLPHRTAPPTPRLASASASASASAPAPASASASAPASASASASAAAAPSPSPSLFTLTLTTHHSSLTTQPSPSLSLSASRSRSQDSVDINKSLFTLRKVILTLSEARPGMPHRASIPDEQTGSQTGLPITRLSLALDRLQATARGLPRLRPHAAAQALARRQLPHPYDRVRRRPMRRRLQPCVAEAATCVLEAAVPCGRGWNQPHAVQWKPYASPGASRLATRTSRRTRRRWPTRRARVPSSTRPCSTSTLGWRRWACCRPRFVISRRSCRG